MLVSAVPYVAGVPPCVETFTLSILTFASAADAPINITSGTHRVSHPVVNLRRLCWEFCFIFITSPSVFILFILFIMFILFITSSVISYCLLTLTLATLRRTRNRIYTSLGHDDAQMGHGRDGPHFKGSRKNETKSGSSNHEIHPAHTKAEPGNSTCPLNTLNNANGGKQMYQNDPSPGR